MLDMFDLLDINNYVKPLVRVYPRPRCFVDAYIMDLTMFEEHILGLDMLIGEQYITITRCNQHYATAVSSDNTEQRGLGRSIAVQANALSTKYKYCSHWYDKSQNMYFVIKPIKGVTNV